MTKLSIIVVAYNHLDYTKKCIESLLKYTAGIDFELIVVNNGSTDGTLEYFHTLRDVKIVDLKENRGTSGGINSGFEAATGEYVLFVSNDLLLTPNWANNLLYCIEADKKIGMVVPASNISSNMQIVSFDYTDDDALYSFARAYNKSDKTKWEERIRLVTYAFIVRYDLFKEIGGMDEDFNSGFDDDDISFRVRRMGYKLILAMDTFVYHFGSVTLSQEYNHELIILKNREKFIKKYNLDSWHSAGFDANAVDFLDYPLNKDEINILGINPLCGGTILQLKNKLAGVGINNIKLYGFTEDERYYADLKTICEDVSFDGINNISNYFKDKSFDYIVVEGQIESFKDFDNFLEALKQLKNKKGKIIFSVKNKSFYKNVIIFLTQGAYINFDHYNMRFFDIQGLTQKLYSIGFSSIKILNLMHYVYERDRELIENLSNCFEIEKREKVKQNLTIYEYKFCIGED